MKDSHFTKKKSLYQKNGTVKEVDADYRKVSVGGNTYKIFKGQVLTKEEVKAFKDAKADKHWLENA